ncbi:hypothetical protein CL614_01960 [archaeon]|nr:hypothetical protein [archaeon]
MNGSYYYFMKWSRIVLLIAIIFIFILVVLGNFLAPPNCYEIGSCNECWSNVETYGPSEYCSGGGSCKTVPYIDQHNTLVDALNCACNEASVAQFTEPQLNSDISTLYRQLTLGGTGTVQEICSGNDLKLVKWFYE